MLGSFRKLKSIEKLSNGNQPTIISSCFEMKTKVFEEINNTFALPM